MGSKERTFTVTESQLKDAFAPCIAECEEAFKRAAEVITNLNS
jgi:hypothetical protein